MRKTIYTFIILLTTVTLVAQETKKEPKYLIKEVETTGGFGGPMVIFSQIGNNTVAMMGGGGGFILNRRLYFGGLGFGSLSPATISSSNPVIFLPQVEADMGMGGVMFGYYFIPESIFYPGIGAQLLWGGISASNPVTGVELYSDNFFCFSPELKGALNVSPNFKLEIGLGYRLFSGINHPVFAQTNFQKPFFGIQFLFGSF